MLTRLVDRIDPLPDDQSVLDVLELDDYEARPGRETYRMGIRNGAGVIYRVVLTQGIGETVRLVRSLQKLGFMEEDGMSPVEGCSTTFRRRTLQLTQPDSQRSRNSLLRS
jgi:hypothetical protein